jgi:hypothetical protein
LFGGELNCGPDFWSVQGKEEVEEDQKHTLLFSLPVTSFLGFGVLLEEIKEL